VGSVVISLGDKVQYTVEQFFFTAYSRIHEVGGLLTAGLREELQSRCDNELPVLLQLLQDGVAVAKEDFGCFWVASSTLPTT
jgi:hypothetical protein